MSESVEHHIETARLRRAPRYGVFFGIGAVLGILTAFVLTFFVGGDAASPATGAVYAPEQVFGFLSLVFIPVGLALGGAVALLLDRASSRRSREVRIDRETVQREFDDETSAPPAS